MLFAPTNSAAIRPSAINVCGTGLAARHDRLPQSVDPATAFPPRGFAGEPPMPGASPARRTPTAGLPVAGGPPAVVPTSKHPRTAERPSAVSDDGAAVWAAYVVQRALNA